MSPKLKIIDFSMLRTAARHVKVMLTWTSQVRSDVRGALAVTETAHSLHVRNLVYKSVRTACNCPLRALSLFASFRNSLREPPALIHLRRSSAVHAFLPSERHKTNTVPTVRH